MKDVSEERLRRVSIRIEGRVQGVGFRPAVYRLARRFSLTGFVKNTGFGVLIEAQGAGQAIAEFIACLQSEKPRQAVIESLEREEINLRYRNFREVGPHSPVRPRRDRLSRPTCGKLPRSAGKSNALEDIFFITESCRSGDVRAGMPPDLAICDLCRQELFDAHNRRCQYPFINCTDCGPRFTIIKRLPYDRRRTSMDTFKMCPACNAEFSNPLNRRFEAQPNACPVCGPRVMLVDARFKEISGDPIKNAVHQLKSGKILAVKGIGGYHICCDALNVAAVKLLRERKNRPHKPLAVMFKAIDQIGEYCLFNVDEAQELESIVAPVVVLRKKENSALANNISPDTDDVGAFLAYAPLHCLLLDKISPLIMTSGNKLDEPMAIDEEGLKQILGAGKIADFALGHNRPIVRRCDDSVLKFMPRNLALGSAEQDSPALAVQAVAPKTWTHFIKCVHSPVPASEQSPHSAGPNLSRTVKIMLRRSRGFVPAPIRLPVSGPPVLACGAELKNTACVTRGDQAFLSPHIGDLDDLRSYNFFQETVRDFIELLEIKPEVVAYDMHPDYLSTRFALAFGDVKHWVVQHHHAHIASCLAEHRILEKVIGIALDGTGYGPDDTIWGGELLIADLHSFQRVGHFKQYPMPGGQAAILNPARMALSILAIEFGADAEKMIQKLLPLFKEQERKILKEMAMRKLHSPLTSSAGRLFDAVAALLGLGGEVSYEGRAAVRLQTLADKTVKQNYFYEIQEENGILVLSFAAAIRAIVGDLERRKAGRQIAGMFHNTVVAALAESCGAIRERSGLNTVALSGGVFQNDLLLEKLTNCLEKQKFVVYTNQLVPPNDGGISLGQAAVAAARSVKRSS